MVNATDDLRDDLHDRLDALAAAGAQGVELARPATAEAGRAWWRGRPSLALAALAVLAIAGTAVGLTAGGGDDLRTGPDSSPAREDASGDAPAWEGDVAALVAVVPGDLIMGTDIAVRFLAPSGDEIVRRNMAELTDDKPGFLEGGMLQAVPEGSQEVELTIYEGIEPDMYRCIRAFHADPGEQIILRVELLGPGGEAGWDPSGRQRCAGRDLSVAEWVAGATGPTGEPYVGLTLLQAEERAQAAGLTTRIVGRDGGDLVIPDDFIPDRLNLVVFADRVVAARLDGE
jgi:hypothetical protein